MANFFKPSNKKQLSGQLISIQIDRLDQNGCGVGRYQNKPVFIENTLPKEQVKAKVVEAKGKFIKAKVVEVSKPSEHRISPLCRHFTLCGGCNLQHIDYSQHLPYKRQKVIDLFTRNNINSTLPWGDSLTSEPYSYRRKARIGVQYNKEGEPTVGFRQKQSNTLVNISQCPVLVEPLADIFKKFERVIKTLSLPKSIGHIEVIYTQRVSVVIRQLIPLNANDNQRWLDAASDNKWDVYIDDAKNISSLTHNSTLFYQLKNVGDLSHPNTLNYDVVIHFEPQDFIQVNHQINKSMVLQALSWLDLNPDDVLLDLFCGLGNFSLPIAQQCKQVVGVEGMQSMVDKALSNAKSNNIENIDFYQADLNSKWHHFPWAQKKYTKVLLDPARNGAYEAIEQLVSLHINTILYVSCDPVTLAKDSKLLLDNGYNIQKISIMDMFVQTKHIETMVLFTKL